MTPQPQLEVRVSKANDASRATAPPWIVTACGLGTTALTVAVLLLVYDFSTWSVAFLIPIGALGAGALAASGYFFAMLWTHTMASRYILLHMVGIAAGAWGVLLWLNYSTMVLEDGTAVKDFLSFWQWFQITSEHTSLTVYSRGGNGVETDALGGWGYAREALQFVGFAMGAVIAYFNMAERPVCEPCRRYMKKRSLTRGLDGAGFDQLMERANLVLPNIADRVMQVTRGRGMAQIALELHSCTKCGSLAVAPLVWTRADGSPERAQSYDASPELVAILDAASAADRASKP